MTVEAAVPKERQRARGLPERTPCLAGSSSLPHDAIDGRPGGHWLAITWVVILATGACDLPTVPDAINPSPSAAVALSREAAVLTTAQDLSEALRAVKNQNEVLIWVKNGSDRRPGSELFSAARGPSVIGMAAGAEEGRRSDLRLSSRPSVASVASLVSVLESRGVEPYWMGAALPVVAVRIPDTVLEATLATLLAHENVDWIEANQGRRVSSQAAPLGNNPTSSNHTLHHVTDAWSHTRGSGAVVGVMDSGMAGTYGTATFHPDLQWDAGGGYGVAPMGFVDDGGGCNSSQKAAGQCLPLDDQGHGTSMVGLVGANDNSLPASDFVGIAPLATTRSMKIAFNADRPGLTCGFGIFGWGDGDFCIEDDDWVAALDWASWNDVGVLSMSFVSSSISVSVAAGLSYAYNTYDILLLAGLGNDPEHEDQDALLDLGWVMGVGGVYSDTQLGYFVNLGYYEVGGYAGGSTTKASCPYQQICGIGTYGSTGGTSAATANVAAIAALVRAANPSLTNVQVRNRLKNTASGRTHKVADADWAIENVTAVQAGVSGPYQVVTPGSHYWYAGASYGLGSYTYLWEKTTGGGWSTVGTGSTLGIQIGESDPDFTLRLTVTSHGRRHWAYKAVAVHIDCDPPECEW